MKIGLGVCLGLLALYGDALLAQDGPGPESNTGKSQVLPAPGDAESTNPVSPARRIRRDPPGSLEVGSEQFRFRSLDGSGNNREQPTMGAAHTWLLRLMEPAYSDGTGIMADSGLPSARLVSNLVNAQPRSLPNRSGTSDFLWQWGQFLDHDIDLTGGADPAEPSAIAVPAGDRFFDPAATGDQEIGFNRSLYDPGTGVDVNNPRQQINEISGWIDASNVYGSSRERTLALRTLDGSGRLKTSAGRLLPFNEAGLANAGGSSATLFLAGDVRANEQLGLTAMHTLFVREHNRLATLLGQAEPALEGDEIFQRARRLVGAEMQIITYREYLPQLLGRGALEPYRGYQPNVDASIANIFSTAAYRYGHSALSPQLLRLDAGGQEIAAGHLPLRDAFFSPARLGDEGGIAPLLRGLAAQTHQAIDPFIVDDVRNFLFGAPGSGGFDLAALNIQRGRDHGLPAYNEARIAMGLAPIGAGDFSAVTSDPALQQRLRRAYGTVDAIDVWIGGLAEDPVPGAQLGELFYEIVSDQFQRLRDGDRFWYERSLEPRELALVEHLRLADIIRLNTEIGAELQDNVFRVVNPAPPGRPAPNG